MLEEEKLCEVVAPLVVAFLSGLIWARDRFGEGQWFFEVTFPDRDVSVWSRSYYSFIGFGNIYWTARARDG